MSNFTLCSEPVFFGRAARSISFHPEFVSELSCCITRRREMIGFTPARLHRRGIVAKLIVFHKVSFWPELSPVAE